MKKVIAILLALVLIFAFAACGNKEEEQEETKVEAKHLSLGHTNNTEHHYHTLSLAFAEAVEEASNGSLIIDVYPAEQLGSGSAMLDSVKAGSQDMVLDPDAYLANYDSRFNVFSVPFTMTSWDQVKRFIGSDLQTTFEEIAEENGFVILGWTANGFRYFSTTTRVEVPSDLAGLKLRVGNNAVMAKFYARVGANPTSMSMSEIYNAVQTKLVDGQENPIANIVGYKLYEVTPYICKTAHVYTWEPLIMSKAVYDSLTEDQQKILKECGAAACASDLEYCTTSEEADFAKCTNTTVIEPDITLWQDAVKDLVDVLCEEYGEEFTKLYKAYAAL